MSLSLNLLYPAGSYVAEGTPTLIDLFCIQGGKRVNKKFSKVFLRITTTPSFSVAETTPPLNVGEVWGEDVIYATKIVNPCDDSVVYVANYITDITSFVNCCTSGGNVDDESDVWIDGDLAEVNDSDDDTVEY